MATHACPLCGRGLAEPAWCPDCKVTITRTTHGRPNLAYDTRDRLMFQRRARHALAAERDERQRARRHTAPIGSTDD